MFCDIHLLPKIIDKARCSVFVFIFLLCFPAYHGIKLQDYDLLIGNGNDVSLFKTSTNESVDFHVVAWSKDTKIRITSAVPDPQTNIIYVSLRTKNSSSISILYPEINQTYEILSSSKNSIGSLTLYKEYLYWCNETNRSLMRLPTAMVDGSIHHELIKPELIFTDANATFESCIVDPKTGMFYYTVWRKSNGSEILTYDLTSKATAVLVQNVYQPKGLYVDTHEGNLYWIDNPPGIYFNIERVSLNDTRNRMLMIKGQNQHPFAIITICGKLYWTDIMNKAVWEYEPDLKLLRALKYFTVSVPYGLLHLTRYECSAIHAKSTVPETSTASILGCMGKECSTNGKYIPGSKSLDVKADFGNSHSTAIMDKYENTPRLCSSPEASMCLNGASCVVLASQTHCICPMEFKGPTCEETTGGMSSCNLPLLVTSVLLGTVVVSLLMVITVMGRKLKKQRPMPKIRRRVVVSHRDVDTSGPGSVCEMIDIENCCNMNICETPCYERLGSFNGSTSDHGGRIRTASGKEDKKCLLTS